MKFAFIGATALVTVASVTPALAQAVIEDPGYCAQFYPNANCQNLGPGNPYTDSGLSKQLAQRQRVNRAPSATSPSVAPPLRWLLSTPERDALIN